MLELLQTSQVADASAAIVSFVTDTMHVHRADYVQHPQFQIILRGASTLVMQTWYIGVFVMIWTVCSPVIA